MNVQQSSSHFPPSSFNFSKKDDFLTKPEKSSHTFANMKRVTQTWHICAYTELTKREWNYHDTLVSVGKSSSLQGVGGCGRRRNYVNYERCLTSCQLHPITGNHPLCVWPVRINFHSAVHPFVEHCLIRWAFSTAVRYTTSALYSTSTLYFTPDLHFTPALYLIPPSISPQPSISPPHLSHPPYNPTGARTFAPRRK